MKQAKLRRHWAKPPSSLGEKEIALEGRRGLERSSGRYFSLSEKDAQSLVWNITTNRRAEFATSKSVPAIKADAARHLFDIDCSGISWAILDSGIDEKHPAFRNFDKDAPAHRIKATYDFGYIRAILHKRNFYENKTRHNLAQRIAADGFGDVDELELLLKRLAGDLDEARPVNWALVEPLVLRKSPIPPKNPHGTHVAGILGGCWREVEDDAASPIKFSGVCPNINLYDFRILGEGREQTEFAVIAALQFIQYLNDRKGRRVIDGVNLSLSIAHNVRNYACGKTPVCNESESLTKNAVVVVAAAGNRGYESFRLADNRAFSTYTTSSITDPGNAELVITVGATHRSSPHTYGVSFFSSRGPTGDGRLKPDIIAPGERD